MAGRTGHFYEFGAFRLDAENRGLWLGDDLVSMAPKTLDVLILLIRHHGDIVSREELLATVWPDTFVEEANITYTVSQLRKTLGQNSPGDAPFVQTIPKRGYRFVADVREVSENGKVSIANVPSGDHRFATESPVSLFEPNGRKETSPPVPKTLIEPENANGHGPGAGKQDLKTGQKPVPHSRFVVFSAIGVVLLSVLGFAGFRFWSAQISEKASAPLESVEFRKLTFTGDLTFPVLSADGNSFAFVRGGGLFIQDVVSGDEIRLNVEGVKTFGILQFSPDGNSLYFRDRVGFDLAGSVFQVSRFGGKAKPAAENVWSGFGFSPDGRQLSFVRVSPSQAESSLIVKDLETGAERKLATVNLPTIFLDNGHSAWSPDGQKIAVVIFRKLGQGPGSELVVVDVESGNIEQIKTPQLWQFEQVAWLPGGHDLIVSAREDGKFFQLWRLAYPGGDVQKVTNDLNIYRGVSISLDGKKLLARQFTLNSHLWIGDKNDLENARQKTFGSLNRDGASGVTWLPNGDILYIARIMGDYDLWLYRPSDDSRRQLTKNAGELNANPAATADGKFIFFNSNRSGASHIWRMDASGTNQTQITFGEKQVELYPQISPDGAWLYYIQKAATAAAVWRKSLIDDRAEPLTEIGKVAPGGFLSLSPDGKLLAFHNAVEKVNAEGEKQNYQIGLISVDRSHGVEFVPVAATRLVVRWSSDGASLDYVENDGDGAKIWRKHIVGNQSPSLVFNRPKAFLHNFAWSPDGEKLALSHGQQLNDAILLTNF